ncbi:ATP-binding protein [Microbispora sp. H10949]|uniref:ATP-binding protein n=1 Tax=Microbispora sp. H10949 TaxID=2729111 RepID=UPI0015FF1F9C|nr:ATP-binding protein [Microbispora sp. H10949]
MTDDTSTLSPKRSGEVRPELVDATIRLRPGGLAWRRTFPGRLEQVSRARRFVRFLLEDSPLGDDLELIVAELAANAVVHTSSGELGGTFIVEVTRKPQIIRIPVYDCGWGGTPSFTQRKGDELAERQRGLAIVAALASRVGFRGTQAIGHAVWAELLTTDPETSNRDLASRNQS